MVLADYRVRSVDTAAYRHAPGFGPRTQEPGRVLWTVSDYVHVLADGMEWRCKVKGKARPGEKQGEVVLPVVGDLVEFEPAGAGEGVITAVLPRASKFSRRAAGGRGTFREQVLAANIDQVLIIFAAAEPEPHPRALDRFLVVAEYNELELLIVANKVDLTGEEAARAIFGVYERADYPVWYTCARQGRGPAGLREVGPWDVPPEDLDFCYREFRAFLGGCRFASCLHRAEPGCAVRAAV